VLSGIVGTIAAGIYQLIITTNTTTIKKNKTYLYKRRWAASCKRAQESHLMTLKDQTEKGTVGKTSTAEPCSLERTMRNFTITKLIWNSCSMIPKIFCTILE